MPDLLKDLIGASWREIAFPITDKRDYGFQQDDAKHRFIFRDQQLIESLGRENPTYRYVVPFREGIVKGPWRNLFTVTYAQFKDACLDRTKGILEDPIDGAVQCKCVSFSETLDVNKKDGVDVSVEFIAAPDQEDIAGPAASNLALLPTATAQAGFFDAAFAQIDQATKDRIAALNDGPPPILLDPFAEISSIGDQLDANKNKFDAKLSDAAFRAQKTADSIDRVKNPNLATTARRAREVQAAATNLQNAVTGPVHPFQTVVTVTDMGLAALAGLYKMPLRDFMNLNGNLRGLLVVPRGTQVRRWR